MYTKTEIELELTRLKKEYGEWSYDIPLPFDIWTKGNLQIPHTRLRRLAQIVTDLVQKPLPQCRILDLACLDGLFSIEFAQQGAKTVGIEIREANIKKAIFCRDVWNLTHLDFYQDDVRNISLEKYGEFDAIICSGILYHLPAADSIELIQKMYNLTTRLVIIDTHISLEAEQKFAYNSEGYWGKFFQEHKQNSSATEKEKKLWASIDNDTSFWFTRPSLMNILTKTGFSSVYECFVPIHTDMGKNSVEHEDRCTFVAIKNQSYHTITCPTVNTFQEKWPENTLSYTPAITINNIPQQLYKSAKYYRKKLNDRR